MKVDACEPDNQYLERAQVGKQQDRLHWSEMEMLMVRLEDGRARPLEPRADLGRGIFEARLYTGRRFYRAEQDEDEPWPRLVDVTDSMKAERIERLKDSRIAARQARVAELKRATGRKEDPQPERPPEEQMQQGGIERVDVYQSETKNQKANRARTWRRRDLLVTLRRNKTISWEMMIAGRKFQAIFTKAAVDPMRAAPLVFLPGSPGPSRPLPGKVEDAREALRKIAVHFGGHGSPGFRALWYVLGCGDTIREWALRERVGGAGAGQRRTGEEGGWQLSEHSAKGVLLGALGALEGYFGL